MDCNSSSIKNWSALFIIVVLNYLEWDNICCKYRFSYINCCHLKYISMHLVEAINLNLNCLSDKVDAAPYIYSSIHDVPVSSGPQ